ncbi:PucR family transcriptional regulator [Microbacterium sp.]|uniref:PucR family transcriptional regulator n=1 Tax=Microbacterium sp. TaxID=51671 RepID=UPI0039E4FC1B
MVDEQRITALVAAVGSRMQEAAPQIVDEMRDLLADRIDGLGQDPQLIDLLRASIDGNVTTLCHILSNDIGIDSLQPTTGAVEYAARLAQRDVPLGALTRAYYLGQALFVRRGIDAIDALGLESMELQVTLTRRVIDVIHNYIDWILKYVTEVHEAERHRWWTARAVSNAVAVQKVMRGEQISERAFEVETKYALSQRHLAVIGWLEFDSHDPDDQRRIDQLVRRAATALGAVRPPLITAADRSTAWAWIALPGALPSDAIARVQQLCAEGDARGIRLALGEPGAEIPGFRRSHEQAAKARLVALGAGAYREARVVSFAEPDVGLLSLIMHDVPGTIAWTHEVLGPVADAGSSNDAMRETLATFYASGENFTRTADALRLHRNTVRQRVNKFIAERGGKRIDALEISLALRMLDLLATHG